MSLNEIRMRKWGLLLVFNTMNRASNSRVAQDMSFNSFLPLLIPGETKIRSNNTVSVIVGSRQGKEAIPLPQTYRLGLIRAISLYSSTSPCKPLYRDSAVLQ